MSERLSRAEQLGREVEAGWRREDVEAQLARLHDRRRTRARRRAIAVPLVALAIAGGVFAERSFRGAAPPPVLVVRSPAPPVPRHDVVIAVPPAPATAPAPARDPAALTLGDGSVVTPLDKTSQLVARRVSDSEVVVALAGGDARFEVPEHAGRRFQAEAGALTVETRGAAFRIRSTGRQIEVSAERGELTARWGRERRLVRAGETRAFPPVAHVATTASPSDESPPPVVAGPTWRDDAARGDYAAAWTALQAATGPRDGMADLLLAGDVARLSGHPAAAIDPLARAIAEHPDDARAQLAAFTLGRVHLEDLGAPRDAAQAFVRARELAPAGPLAEDALAREVEAWSRAGETELARTQARAYLQRYPHGRRVHAVRRFGGMGDP